MLAMLSSTVASGVQAQRVVRETAAQVKAARVLTLTAQSRWCTSADANGCDFRSIDDVLLLPDGGIVASGAQGPMRRFAADGMLTGPLGAKGKGPGEYGFIVQPQLVRDQVFWFDNTQMRVASVTLANVPGRTTPAMLPQTTGMMYMVADTLVVLDVPASPDTGSMVSAQYRTVSGSGAPRVLATVRTPARFLPGTNFTPMSLPFTPRVVADVGANGAVAHSNGTSYNVDVFPVKSAAWKLELPSVTRPVTQADKDSVINSTLKIFRAANLAALPQAARDRMVFSIRNFPPLNTIRVLRDGTVWIRPTTQAGEKTARWDVFSADGKRIGQARLPLTARVRDGMRDWVMVVELSEDDVPSVIKYTIK